MAAISVAALLEDRPSAPGRAGCGTGSRRTHDQIIELDRSELSPRDLAVRFTDEKRYFVFETTVDRLLKAHDLITSPAFVVIKAADPRPRVRTRCGRPEAQLSKGHSTHFKIFG